MPEIPALVSEATKKSDLVWLACGDSPVAAAWHVWHDGAAYVLTGPGEQPVPDDLWVFPTCEVIVRSADNLGRVVSWEAMVWKVAPGTEEWTDVLPALLAKRLNLRDGAAAADRWAAECTVFRLVPTGRLFEAGDAMPTESGAEPPRPTPATSEVRLPFQLSLARRRRRARPR